jgi:hypothetical protein
MLTLNDGRSELWQWDTGRSISVDADCSQVHFGRNVYGRSINVGVVDGIAKIPDVLLQIDKPITAWAFIGTPGNGYTKISKEFVVNKRNKPADYVFTQEEQITLKDVIKRIEDVEESQNPEAIAKIVNDYLEENPVESPVQSVNGKTGKVHLNAEDVGALPKSTKIPKEYVLPTATEDYIGGVKADPTEKTDTQPVRIGADGKLYTAPGASGGGNAEPNAIAQHRRLRTFTVPADVSADTSGITWITDDTGAVTGFEFDTDADGNAFTCTELLLFAQGRCAEAGRVDFYTGNTELCSMPSMQMAGERTTTAKIYKFGRVWVIEGSIATAHRFQHDAQGVSRSGWVGRYKDTTVTEITSFKAQGQKAFSSGYMFDIWGR